MARVWALALTLLSSVIAQAQGQSLLDQARRSAAAAARDADAAGAGVEPALDAKSFILIWTPPGGAKQWMATLHGTGGWAFNEWQLWRPALQPRQIGVVALQWWFGAGNRPIDYATPEAVYRELDRVLSRLGVAKDAALLHGFSRGASNIYAVAALDRARGRGYFGTVIANSGGAALDYPPTRQIEDGGYGRAPLAGTRWIVSCGDRDPNPDRDGCPAMRRTAAWLERQGGTVAAIIADPRGGHGALMRDPALMRRALDLFQGR